MFRVLFLKEVREIWWIGLLALGAMLYAVAGEVEFGRDSTWTLKFLRHSDPGGYHAIPFGNGTFARMTILWGCILGAILGIWQTFRETQARTWHFLLHRPVPRLSILHAKMAAAGAVYGIAILLPLLILIIWNAIPGTHASPVLWFLVLPSCLAAVVGSALYFAALFAGLRRGRILGSRWWPLVAAVVCFGFGPPSLPHVMGIWMWGFLVLWNLLLMSAVQDEMRSADFN